MGRDMYLSLCEDPTSLGFFGQEVERRIEELCVRATAEQIEEFFAFYDNDGGNLQAAYDEYIEVRAEENPIQNMADQAGGNPALAWGRREMCSRIQNAMVNVQRSRNVGTYTFGGSDYLVTGGVTWGDDPTEACADVSMISWLDLYPTPQRRKFWELDLDEHCPYKSAAEFPNFPELFHVVQMGPKEILLWLNASFLQQDPDSSVGYTAESKRREDLYSLQPELYTLLRRAKFDRVSLIRWVESGPIVDYLPRTGGKDEPPRES